MYRSILALTGLVAFVATAGACRQPPDCHWGVSSYATATRFPLDGVIVIRSPWPERPADMPSMHALFTLSDLETGEALDYEITYLSADHAFELRPTEPLLADHRYGLAGGPPPDDWTMHYLEGTSFPTVMVAFDTGGALTPVEWRRDGDGPWYVGWTEALEQPLPEGFTLEAMSSGGWTPVDPAALSVHTSDDMPAYGNVLRIDSAIEPAARLRITGPTPEQSLNLDETSRSETPIVEVYSGLGWCGSW